MRGLRKSATRGELARGDESVPGELVVEKAGGVAWTSTGDGRVGRSNPVRAFPIYEAAPSVAAISARSAICRNMLVGPRRCGGRDDD